MELPSVDILIHEIDQTQDVAWNMHIDNKTKMRWINNFKGEALGDAELEQQLAYWLLYNFTFFNEGEIKHLCKTMLRKYLHCRFSDKCIITMEMVKNEILNTRFKGLGRESESGAYITYLFRQENDLPISLFVNDTLVLDDNPVVFIDDVTISGNQASTEIDSIKYSDNKLSASDVSDELVGVFGSIRNGIIPRLCELHEFSCNNKNDLIRSLNRYVINNTEFWREVSGLLNTNLFDMQTQKLIDEYEKSELPEIAIRKMNRLVIEEVFSEYISKSKRYFNIDKLYLLTFIASREAIRKLKEKGVEVVACIEIDESSEAFSNSSIVFLNVPQYREPCKIMCEYYGQRISEYPLGYDNSQLLIGFYYSIPNNTLPIFWSNRNSWEPLFSRHEKRYKEEIDDVFGRYL